MIQVQIIILYQDQREYLKMNNLSRFESDQRPSVAGFLIVLEIVIGPTNSSQSDALQNPNIIGKNTN